MATYSKVKNYKGFVIARQLGANDAFFVFLARYWQYHTRAALVSLFSGSSVKCCEKYINEAVVDGN